MCRSSGWKSRTKSWRLWLPDRANEDREVELDGRIALVTGAGTRVGRVIALALGKAGMRVGVHYAGSEKGARQTADEIVAAGSDARTLPGDLTDPATGPRLIEHANKVFGGLDVLVNSADRKSTRLNSSHVEISYAVFCLKK